MQLRLPWTTPPPRSPERANRPAPGPMRDVVRAVEIAGVRYPVLIARHPRARRYVLRLTPAGALRLTVPRGQSIEGGLRFVSRQGPWVSREQDRRTDARGEWSSGTGIWWRGERVSLVVGTSGVSIGPDRMPPVPTEGSVRGVFERWARALAQRELVDRCQVLASSCGEAVTAVRVRGQRTRWGSCSPRRVIALNWRLVQTPASVSDYVIFHELMHLRQPNHSRRFWREVERVCPAWRLAERWLRTHGREIL